MNSIRKNKKTSILLVMMLFVTVIGWMALSENAQATPNLGETLLVGDANADNKFNVQDLVRIKRYSNGSETDLTCTLDGDLNVDGTIGDNDDVRCREMLVTGNHSLQVDVKASNYAKEVEDIDGYYMYYDLKKGLKAGQTLTFKIELPETVTNYGVYAYYAGNENWLELAKNVSASGSVTNTNTYRLVPNVDITQVQIRVVNKSTNAAVAFRIYDIQVYASSAGGAVTDMQVCYQQSTDIPVVFGTNDTLDLTKFSVDTASQDLTYTWSIAKSGGSSSNLDMTNTAYKFSSTGTYMITAKVNKNGYSGSASQTIYVVAPQVYVGYDNGTVKNTGTSTSATASIKGLSENSSGACTSIAFENYTGTVTYVPGIDGDSKGAFKINNRRTDGAMVVNGYTLPSEFTLSTWFNVADDNNITTGSGGYLLGNAYSDGTSGFSITLKRQDASSNVHQLRIKLGSNAAVWVDIDLDRYGWNNLTLCCENSTLSVYMNGEKAQDVPLPSGYSFGSAPVAFGAYPVESGKTFTYVDRAICYDDVQIYNSVLDFNTISAIVASDKKGADVKVDFNGGTIKNTGISNATASAYKLSADKGSDTTFVKYSDVISFVDGFQKESGGAIVTNHKSGPYTVVKNHGLTTDNFTISTWFNMTEDLSTYDSGGYYLFGTTHTDGTDGFLLHIKPKSKMLRLKVNGTNYEMKDITFTPGIWRNVTLTRDNTSWSVYLDGVKKGSWTLSSVVSLKEKDISFGAYTGFPYEYKDTKTYFADIRIYDSILSVGDIKDMYNSKAANPVISVSYTAGTMDNTGDNDRATIGAYHLNQTANASSYLVSSDVLPFTSGAAGDAYGGFATTHKDGSYTVVRDHVFGTKNFTINTWFNISKTSMLDTSASYYLLGTSHPDESTGFSLCLKKNQIRVRIAGTSYNDQAMVDSWESNKWNHLSLRRDGKEMSLWLNGVEIWTASDLAANYDFGTADLSFGGYEGFGSNYKDTVTSYDELRIYDVPLSDDVIVQAADTTLEDITLEATDRSAGTSNTDLFYVNAGQRKAWDPGVIYIEEGPYAGTFCLYVAHENQIKVSTSTDLVNWSEPVACYKPLETEGTWIADSVWAPEVIYEDGIYYLFFSAKMINSADDAWRSGYKYIGLATSTDPTKGFVQYTNSKIGVADPLFGGKYIEAATEEEKQQDYIYQGFIDAHPFVDPKTGQKYLYMVRNRDNSDSNIIAVIKMNSWTEPDHFSYKELTTVGYTTFGGTTKTELDEGVLNEAAQVLCHEGKYYLTFSINAATDPDYAVVQAVGDSPMGPFTKVQKSDGGLLLGANLFDTNASNKISGSGHHCFVQVEDELYIVYHQHNNPANPNNDRILAVDRVYWTTNSKGATVLKANGPTRSMQPKASFASGYSNLATGAHITDSKSSDTVKYLNDELIKYSDSDVAKQYEVSGFASGETVTMTMTFDDFVKARALLLYNSSNYNNAFASVKNVALTYRQVEDGVTRTGKMTLNSAAGSPVFSYDFGTWSYDSASKYLSTGAPMVLEFAEMEINEVTIEFVPRSGATSLAISEMMLLGQEMPTPDVYINYTGGKLNYATSDVAATVGTYGPNAQGKFTAFVEKNDITYTTGIEGDANGAISMQHTKGAYTVVDKYSFGTNDFTISTWFNIPTTSTQDSSSGAGTYLFGNSQPDEPTTGSGFSVCLKPKEIRFRVNGVNQKAEGISYDKGTWNNVVLCRKGSSLKLYFNGELISASTISATYDFGTKDLAFGGYYNNSNNYHSNLMFFDEIQVYESALSASKIEEIANQF